MTRYLCLLYLLTLPFVHGADYFVSTTGNDSKDGRTTATAFATIQHGVDALAPGDTLTIAPGEYHGSVRRKGIGSDDVITTIRAQERGSVVLRGDRPLDTWTKVDGYRFVYACDFASETPVAVVNELDTLSVLQGQPNLRLLEMAPGSFFQDTAAGKLYLSSSDLVPVPDHRYSASVNTSHGIYLQDARKVVIEGINVTGFNASGMLSRLEGTLGATYGIFLYDSSHCVIRHTRAYLNGSGIGISSTKDEDGHNVVEYCQAWANSTMYGWGDHGGITINGQRRGSWEVVRHCSAYLNHIYGINIYSGEGPQELDDARRNVLVDNLAWGNEVADFKIKTGHENSHRVIRGVGPGLWSTIAPEYSLLGKQSKELGPGSIMLEQEEDLVPEQEFADPYNLDYRLQATSRFRGAGPDGKDRGPLPYEANVYFLRPDGDDQADGLSIAHAWKTLAAAPRLKTGDTLYFSGGTYALPDSLTLPENVSLRGRGKEPVILTGKTPIIAKDLSLRRLHFQDQEVAMDSALDPRELAERMTRKPKLVGPFVSSVTDTTANVEWWVAIPGRYRLEWGEAPDFTESAMVDSAQAGNFSLMGLKPGTTYAFRLTETGAANEPAVRFETATASHQPTTWYVATDGDNTHSGTNRDTAWRTVSYAADQVRPGDTVLIAGGTYHESVRLKATGEADRPITFKALPGEKVLFDGLNRTLGYAFLATDKSHLRFDGFYFHGFVDQTPLMPWAHRTRGLNGAIVLYRSDDVQITRCFSDGRGTGGYAPGLLQAMHCRDVLVRNCVTVRSMSGAISFASCPNLRLEHNVFLINLISNIAEGLNAQDQPFYLQHNIITDNIAVKFHAPLFAIGTVESLREGNNCYFLRGPDDEKRPWQFYGTTAYGTAAAAYAMPTELHNPVFTELTRLSLADYQKRFNPESGSFCGDPGFQALKAGHTLREFDYSPQSLISKEDLDFPDLFATSPDVVAKDIGLQPKAFADFHFNQ